MTRLTASALLVGLIASSLTGCGSSPGTAPVTDEQQARQGLDDLGNLLRAVADEKKRPPAKPADLEPYTSGFTFATTAIQQKKIVYVWGTGLGSGSAVVAYDATAESAGGLVLLQDGTIKKMSADEFKAAPKAK